MEVINMRYRVFEDVSDTGSGHIHYTNQYGGESDISNSTFALSSSRHTLYDVEDHEYGRKLKRGELVIHPMTSERSSFQSGGGSMSGVGSGPYEGAHWEAEADSMTQYCERAYGGPNYTPLDPQANAQEAMAKCLANIAASPVNVAEDVLEWKRTMMLFNDLVEQIGKEAPKAYQRLKKGFDVNFNIHFGLGPTFRTLCELIELTDKGLKTLKAGTRLRAKGQSVATSSGSEYRKPGYVGYSCFHNTLSAVRAGVYYRLRNPLEGVAWNVGVNPSELVVGRWNVIPLSFMVDRVFDVSSLARAFMNMTDPNITIEGGYVTHYLEKTVVVTATEFDSGSPYWAENVSGDPATTWRRVVSRSPWTPTIADVVPPVDISGLVSTSTRVNELAGLVAQKLLHLR
jgi:hypothetical protein